MRPLVRNALLAVGGVGATAALVGLWGWRRELARCEVTRTSLLSQAVPPTAVDADSAGRLPRPVRRYLLAAAGPRDRPMSTATLTQRGRMRETSASSWIPFTATQTLSLEPPAFLWVADATMAGAVPVVVRDELLADRGRTRAVVAGLFAVADASGPEVDQGATLRFWGEVLAFSEAVTSPRLRWSEVDDDHARLHVGAAGRELEATVDFDAAGRVSAIHATRFRMVDGVSVATPWTGRFTAWKTMGGRSFPTRWESAWNLPEGDLVAVEIDIVGIEVRP